MKERPILFSPPMVRALLCGAKTQTRRVVKPQPYVDAMGNACWGGFNFGQSADKVPHIKTLASPLPSSKTGRVHCPFGRPGDRLWVRESFWGCDLPGYGDQPCIVYDDEWQGKEYKPAQPRPWGRKFGRIPSIHMPRDCSRITLEITAVRVERLNDISEADSVAEGCGKNHNGYFWGGPHAVSGLKQMATARQAYRDLWESINGPGSWDANPWVWIVEFKRLEQPA